MTNTPSIDHIERLAAPLTPLIRWRSWTSNDHIGICAPQSVSTSTTIEETQSHVRRILAENAIAEQGIIRAAIEMASARIVATLPNVPRTYIFENELCTHLADGRIHDHSMFHDIHRDTEWRRLSNPLRHLARPVILRFRQEHIAKYNGVCSECGAPHTRVEELDVEYLPLFDELQTRFIERTIRHQTEGFNTHTELEEEKTPPRLQSFALDALLKEPLTKWSPARNIPAKDAGLGWKHLVEEEDLDILKCQFEIPRLGDVLGAWTIGNSEWPTEVIEHWAGNFILPDLEYSRDQHAEAEIFYRYSTKSRDSREEGRTYPTLEAALRAENGASFDDALRDGLRFGLTPWCWFYGKDLSTNPHLNARERGQFIAFLSRAAECRPTNLELSKLLWFVPESRRSRIYQLLHQIEEMFRTMR
jgi:hypothetical protein